MTGPSWVVLGIVDAWKPSPNQLRAAVGRAGGLLKQPETSQSLDALPVPTTSCKGSQESHIGSTRTVSG